MQVGTDNNGCKIFGSARDIGNYVSGYVAGKRGLFWGEARLGFDLYQSYKSRKFCVEGAATQDAEAFGFSVGENTSQIQSLRLKLNAQQIFLY